MIGMNAQNGQAIKDLTEHVKQSINDIINTPVGTRLMRKDYGSVVPYMIDQPMNSATTLQLYSSIATALMVWEKRITLNAIALTINAQGQGQIELDAKINDQQVRLNVPVLSTPSQPAAQ